jgi:hypothetical protein
MVRSHSILKGHGRDLLPPWFPGVRSAGLSQPINCLIQDLDNDAQIVRIRVSWPSRGIASHWTCSSIGLDAALFKV